MELSLTVSQGYIFIVSFLLTVGLFYVILFFAFRKKVSYVFFSLLCFFHIAKLMIRPDQDFLVLNAQLSEMVDRWHSGPFILGSICLIGFLLFEFGIPKKGLILGAFTGLMLAFYAFKVPPFGLIIVTGLGVAALALKRDKEGGIYAIVALLLFAIFTRLEFAQKLGLAYYLGVVIFIVTMTILVGQRIKMTIRNQREAQIKSVQLENQLLKSTIQPHFITNSLTSLQELIETDPKEANRFIENLAEEFRLFSLVADQQLIPIEKELSLCQTHLEIMNKRKLGTYKLSVSNVTGAEKVPPGIFHTLIENGLTHGYRTKSEGHFELSKHCDEKGTTYQLSNDGELPSSSNREAGTGFRYIKNRLIENYGEDWHFESGSVDGRYQVAITIPS